MAKVRIEIEGEASDVAEALRLLVPNREPADPDEGGGAPPAMSRPIMHLAPYTVTWPQTVQDVTITCQGVHNA